MSTKTTCYVISHTHWDREWYRTFESFRNRLVFLMDELIDHLETDPDYRHFHLDGQTILIDDFLEIRPEQRSRLDALLKSNRIIAGPWYVMPDEFLVSGESQVRNLLKGHEICKEHFTQPMKNGFLLDEFGHHSQMPQILNGFGCRAAVLYRGIGDYPKNAFKWRSPDGSEVLAMKLDPDRSYSNFYFAVRWPFDERGYEKTELIERAQKLIDYSRKRAVSDELLLLDGVDHLEIEPKLSEVIESLNRGVEDTEFVHSTMLEYEQALRGANPDLEKVEGELYEIGKYGINNQLLKNVLSSMVQIKQLNDECERLLSRWVEPFDAFSALIEPIFTDGFLRQAWTYLLQNHPHDSICGCSISRVHEDNEYRYNQCRDIGQELLLPSFRTLSGGEEIRMRQEQRSLVVYNAGQRGYRGVVEAELELPPGTQGIINLRDHQGRDTPVQIIEIKRKQIRGKFRHRRLPAFVPCDVVRVAFEAEIPACGQATFPYADSRIQGPDHGDYTFREFHAPRRSVGSMKTGELRWDTGKLEVTISAEGSVDVRNRETGRIYRDIIEFEDGGDLGDGWNYRKPIHDRLIKSGPGDALVSVLDDGPLVARVLVTHTMKIPVETDPETQTRSDDVVDVEVGTTLKLRKGSSVIECATEVENRAMDHRLRVLMKTDLSADVFSTATPFWMQPREIKFPDRSSYIETETNVYPNQGIITIADEADRVNVYNRGLYEVELIDDRSRAIALSLFRSFRRETGASEPSKLGRLFRELLFKYALDFRSSPEDESEAMIRGTDWRVGVRSRCYGFGDTSGDSSTPTGEPAGYLSLIGTGLVLSSFRRGGEWPFVLRVFNATALPTEGSVDFSRTIARCSYLTLLETVLEDIQPEGHRIPLKAKPGEIMTIGLSFLDNE